MITKKDIENLWDSGLYVDAPEIRDAANKMIVANLNKMHGMGVNIEPIVKILNTPSKK